jgi:RNA recognition motif-containing protein
MQRGSEGKCERYAVRKVQLWGLPPDASEKEVSDLVRIFAEPQDIYVSRRRAADGDRAVAFVSFADDLSAGKVLYGLKGMHMGDCTISTRVARLPSDQPGVKQPIRLHVTNLNSSMTTPELYAMFAPFGLLVSFCMAADTERYRSDPDKVRRFPLTYGCVAYADEASARRAKHYFNVKCAASTRIRVSDQVPTERRREMRTALKGERAEQAEQAPAAGDQYPSPSSPPSSSSLSRLSMRAAGCESFSVTAAQRE